MTDLLNLLLAERIKLRVRTMLACEIYGNSTTFAQAVRTLVDRGYGETGVDFLAEKKARASCIVTNPPFSLDEEFIEHALRLGVDLAIFFLPIKKLAGADRFRRIHGPTPPAPRRHRRPR